MSQDRSRSTAIEQLGSLGLSTYAARTFVALVSLRDGTAQDVSDVSDVPRTRVYDAVAELRDWGLVDVQESSPKRFHAVSTETAGRRFEREYTNRVATLTEALDGVDPSVGTEEQRGVWTVTGRDTVTDRVVEFVDGADEEIVFTTAEDLLTPRLLDHLRDASERGVPIRLAGTSAPVAASIREAVPEVTVFDSLWDWSDTPAGRLLMVDRERTLVSALVEGDGDYPPEPYDETAIWGTGPTNSLVVVVRALFPWQLDGNRD